MGLTPLLVVLGLGWSGGFGAGDDARVEDEERGSDEVARGNLVGFHAEEEADAGGEEGGKDEFGTEPPGGFVGVAAEEEAEDAGEVVRAADLAGGEVHRLKRLFLGAEDAVEIHDGAGFVAGGKAHVGDDAATGDGFVDAAGGGDERDVRYIAPGAEADQPADEAGALVDADA
jgi:hypothetical protein